MSLYSSDFYAWAMEQSQLIKDRQNEAIDIFHLVEEIEGLANRERKALESSIRVLLGLLLKWKVRKNDRYAMLRLLIREQRMRVNDVLDDNPSLRSQVNDIIPRAYRYSSILAIKMTGVDSFPEICPWDFWEFMDPEFWPE
ncbi:DUF29 domain-containing protein [Pantoea sp. Al-1710]|uniref:DUF29 domain-containing protein n=1 Tax=Candidatus Pantoea communis TaxID=2608354 RepID=A0ABX0RJL7_9GAMM|nr:MULTISPECIES: DUF29 domain-containing protein [Pantoea]NIG13000.1 DUF29 domain-containing protein [Pantoea sp. Cy-640]NIG17299.1 DUF29 domain-containing protein [Pantoea communis]